MATTTKLNPRQADALRRAYGNPHERAWAQYGRSWHALARRGLVDVQGISVSRTAAGEDTFAALPDDLTQICHPPQ